MIDRIDMAPEIELVAEDVGLAEMVEGEMPGNGRLAMCIQCGTCGGSCPSAADTKLAPCGR